MLEAQLAALMASAEDEDEDDDEEEDAPLREEDATGEMSDESFDEGGGPMHGRVWRREHNLSDSKLEVARRAEQFESPRPHRSAGGERESQEHRDGRAGHHGHIELV